MDERVDRNWSGTRAYHASEVVRPRSLADLPGIVTGADTVRALGTRHCFNGAADTTGTHVLLDQLGPTVEVDVHARTATVSAWATYGQVAPTIHDHGLALDALASLPHISVVGACATATHGSGTAKQALSSAVRAMTFVDGTGAIVEVSREQQPETFPGMVVHLGALGIVTSMTLDLVDAVPWFQREWEALPRTAMVDHLDDIMGSAENVSVFTRWQDDSTTVLRKSTVDDASPTIFGARPSSAVHDGTANRTDTTGRPGPWYERLPHFRVGFTPSTGEEIQSEWFVDRDDAAAVLDAVWEVGHELDEALIVTELRTVAADDLWLSPAHGRDVFALHCTWRDDVAVVEPAIDVVEEALSPFDPMPHWGKVSHLDRGEAARRHCRVEDFAGLVARHDPAGRFRNEFVDELLR